MIIGAHLGISGGLPKAADKAKLLGCEAIQIFTSNPRGWNFQIREKSEIEEFKNKIKKYNIRFAFGHAIYLVNLASTNTYIYNNSINSLISGITLSEKAGLSGIVTHLGSHTGTDFKTGIKQILAALEQILNSTNGSVPILLETDAGSGNRIGCKFSDIGLIARSLKSDLIKVCLDTCHSFVSGYELRTKKGIEETLAEFDKEIGLDKLVLIHLNDSKGDLGSNLDRHEVIGEGFLGTKAFNLIINHPRLRELPGIIETPDAKSFLDEITSLKKLRKLQQDATSQF